MKAKVKINIGTNFKNILKQLKDPKIQTAIGLKIKQAVIEITQSGLSPVKNQGRFERYASQRAAKFFNQIAKHEKSQGRKETAKALRKLAVNSKNKRYPYSVMKKYPNKSVTPVNLTLSGAMLDGMEVRPENGGVTLGWTKGKHADMAHGHHHGVQKIGLPVRKILPNRSGEEFIISVTRIIRGLYVEALDKILKK